jgi:hypothetical protein
VGRAIFQTGEDHVKKIAYFLFAVLLFVPGAFAQSEGDHFNAGLYGNFLRFEPGGVNLAGVGARVSVNIFPVVQFEAESAYDFEQAYSSRFNGPNGTVSIATTNFRSVDALFGPKLQTNKGPVRLFVTAKGGFINFLVSSAPATVGTFTNSFGVSGGNAYGVFYPGGGAEAFWGPIGLRVDIGDEIYFNNGGHNNLKVTFGPTIRF